MNEQCDPDTLEDLVRAMASDPGAQFERIEALIARFPADARLHFLRGSSLIGAGRLIEGHDALTRAVALAPDFAIARFQLGLFQLTSGEAGNALATWAPLDALDAQHYLRRFVDGLRRLIDDDFVGATAALSEGIALNQENEPLNRDMALIIERCAPLIEEGADGAVSETALALKRFSSGPFE